MTCDGICGLAIVDNTYDMGHNRFKIVIGTELDYNFYRFGRVFFRNQMTARIFYARIVRK